MTDKVDAPKSVDAVVAALFPSMFELIEDIGRHSQRQMAAWLPHSPNLSTYQVSDCH